MYACEAASQPCTSVFISGRTQPSSGLVLAKTCDSVTSDLVFEMTRCLVVPPSTQLMGRLLLTIHQSRDLELRSSSGRSA